MTWPRMCIKAEKSRSLVLKRGKVTDRFPFSRGGTQIPSVREKLIKSLVKTFDCTLKDAISIRATNLEEWLTTGNKSGLPDKIKAWMHQRGILLMILWPLLLCEFPLTMVEDSHFIRGWGYREA